MATLASISAHSCEAASPFLRLPLIISESLRSAVSYDGPSTQGIVSILLSATDLAKLDLSRLQLFSVDGLPMEPVASSEVVSAQTEVKTFLSDDFSFPTPLILSPVSVLPPGDITFPVLKSKGVVEAEKASAEHHLLKLRAVLPSPRVRKKAVSMDEMKLNENLGKFDIGVSENVAEQSNSGAAMARARVRARRQLPELELAAMPTPGLEQRAESLSKKHFERVLSRTLSEIRSEDVKIDLKASPTAKFLLQVMPWELTPPTTPVTTTPAGIPFMWEDVPGRPKSRALPSPCPSLPLPPRLLLAPPPSSSSSSAAAGTLACPSDSAKLLLPHVDGKQSFPVKSNPPHGRTHRKSMHSWHVLHNLFSGGSQRCPSHAALEAHTPAREPKNLSVTGSETSEDGISSGSTSVHSNSNSSDLSPSTATASEDVLSSHESSLGACYELPPIYVAPVVPLTPPHRDLGPLEDGCGKQTNRLSYLARIFRRQQSNISRTGSFHPSKKHGKVASDSNCCLLDDANGSLLRSRFANGVHKDECSSKAHLEVTSGTRKKSFSAQMSPIAASLYRPPKPGKPRIRIGLGRMKVFLKLRRRGSRVIVVSCRAVKRALFLRRVSHSKLFNHTQLPYHASLRRA